MSIASLHLVVPVLASLHPLGLQIRNENFKINEIKQKK
jgi:hypothetical protein